MHKPRFLKNTYRFIVRHTRRPPVGRIDYGDLRRVTPISKDWGFDRGLPIDRYYIQQFLSNHASDIRGRVLEIANNEYTLRYGADRVTKSDILHDRPGDPRATLIGDLVDAPHIPSESFDCIICTQTLQLIYNLVPAVETLYRLLAPGGVLLVTVPGIGQISPEDMAVRGDYWRFTTASARHLFGNVCPNTRVEVASCGNVLASVALLHGLAVQEVDMQELDYLDHNYQTLVTVRIAKVGSS